MDPHLMLALQGVANMVGGLIMIAALFLLWRKSQSEWLLIALVAEGASFVFRLAVMVDPGLLQKTPVLLVVWPIVALLVAVGVFGYALAAPGRTDSPRK